MGIDEINEVVEKLKGRIDLRRDALSKNETATRYALIDPLLTALGWDVSEPAQVQPEYRAGDGYADYAMLAGRDKPSLVIEAKRLGRPISDGISQSITYCIEEGIEYFVVTNGERWAAYETHKPAPINEKRLVEFSISDPTQTTVMKALWLWRGNFELVSSVKPTSLGGLEDPGPEKPPNEPPKPPVPSVPLSKLKAKSGDPAPATLIFPDGKEKSVTKWNQVQIATVEWLTETNRLTPDHCPLTTPRGTYLVNTSNHRHDGKEFSYGVQVNGLYIDKNKSIPNHVSTTKQILTHLGVDLTQVRVVEK